MRIVISLVIFTINTWSLNAQQSVILDNYVQEGLSNNVSLKKQEIALKQALNSIDLARSNYAPDISFAPTYTLAAGGRNLQFPIGDLLNPVYGTLNQLTQSNSFPQVENVNEQLAPNNFHETVITVKYPLFNPSIKYNWLIQKELLQSEKAKQAVLEHELTYQIKTAYLNYLMSLEGLETINQSLVFLSKFIAFNEKLVKNKVALKDVVLSAQLEESKVKQQLIKAESQSKTAKAYFNFLLNKTADSQIEVDVLFLTMLPKLEEYAFYESSAQQNRLEFAQFQSGINVSETAIEMAEKNAKLPEVFLGGSAGFQGFGYTFNKQAFAVGQVGLKWDLFHGKEKHYKIQEATIQKNMLNQQLEELKHQISFQVQQAHIEAKSSQQYLQEIRPTIAQNASLLSILESKYKNGAALNIEVLKAQNDLQVAQLNQVLAKYDLWIKITQIEKVSGY